MADLPDTVERAVMRALSKQSDERFSSVAELRASLSAGFVSAATLPAGFAALAAKKTILLPDDTPPVPGRAPARTVELTDQGQGEEDIETIRIETRPLPERSVRSALAFRIAVALAFAAALLVVGGLALLHRWRPPSHTEPWPAMLAAPSSGATRAPLGLDNDRGATTPGPAEQLGAREAAAAPPKPAAAHQTSIGVTEERRPLKVTQVDKNRRARRNAAAAAAQQRPAPPAAPDESEDSGWVIRRR